MRLRTILAIALIALGVILGAYIGVWFMFVGGIISIVHGVQASPANAGDIAWGIVRIVFSESSALFAWPLIALGVYVYDHDPRPRRLGRRPLARTFR